MMRLLFALLLVAAPVHAATPDTAGLGFDQHAGAALPLDARFVEADGRAVALGALIGRPLILLLGYFHCPNICGIAREDALAALAASGLVAGQDYTLAYVSIDAAETPEQAAQALASDRLRDAAAGGTADWHYLTGDSASLRHAVGFQDRYDAGLGQFLHPAGLVFVTPRGAVSSYLPGVGYSPADVRAGVLRARDGVFAAASPILLLCLHFDPTTGRYTLAVMRLLQGAAVLTAVAIGGTLVLAHRRGRPA